MIFGFVAKHRGIWPVAFLCGALGVSRSGFYAWLTTRPSANHRMALCDLAEDRRPVPGPAVCRLARAVRQACRRSATPY